MGNLRRRRKKRQRVGEEVYINQPPERKQELARNRKGRRRRLRELQYKTN
jgi:rRNA processing protein Gar1